MSTSLLDTEVTLLHRRRISSALAGALLLLLAFGTAPALAGTVSTDPDGSVHFTAASGESNSVLFTTGANGRVRVSDVVSAPITASPPCTKVTGANAADCNLVASTPNVIAELGDRDDDATNTLDTIPAQFSGGLGNDTLIGAGEDDTLDGGNGADELSGGAGADTADYSARTAAVRVTIDGIGDDGENCPNLLTCEGDNVNSDVENIAGGAGNDTLFGNAQANELSGGAGNDLLQGGNAADIFHGEGGTDTVSYGDHGANVTASLSDGTESSSQDGSGDTYPDADVENLTGGSGNDTLTGSDSGVTGGGVNALFGGAGN